MFVTFINWFRIITFNYFQSYHIFKKKSFDFDAIKFSLLEFPLKINFEKGEKEFFSYVKQESDNEVGSFYQTLKEVIKRENKLDLKILGNTLSEKGTESVISQAEERARERKRAREKVIRDKLITCVKHPIKRNSICELNIFVN